MTTPQFGDRLRNSSAPVIAVATLACIVAGFLFGWPVASPAFFASPLAADASRMVVDAVKPGGPAAAAGLQVGDVITSVDGLPIPHYMVRAGWNAIMHWPSPPNLALSIERSTGAFQIEIPLASPSQADQVQKLGFLVIALTCWFAGFRLTRLVQTTRGARAVGMFWMSCGAILGLLWFAWSLAHSLFMVLLWLLVLVVLPGTLLIHSVFPPRPVSFTPTRSWQRWYLVSLVAANIGLLVYSALAHPSVASLVYLLMALLPVTLLIGVGGSVAALAHSYVRYSLSYVRRPIRLIAAACLINIVARLLFRYGPQLLGWNAPFDGAWIDSLIVLVPLAYLAGGSTWNLAGVDRLVVRTLGFLISLSIVSCIALVTLSLADSRSFAGNVAILALCGALVFQTNRAISMLSPGHRIQRQREARLEGLLLELAGSLDAQRLASILVNGISEVYHASVACYLARSEQPGELQLMASAYFPELPPYVPQGEFQAHLIHESGIVDGATLARELAHSELTVQERALVHHPMGALWCPFVHQRQVFGFVVVGLPNDLDPYPVTHQYEIRRIATAAALAFANSQAYQEIVRAEAEKRELVRRLHRSEDEAARDIWFEIHDDVINLELAGNIAQLERLLSTLNDAKAAEVVSDVIDSEKMVSDMLRDIGNFVYPSGDDDPLRFPASVRNVLRLHQQRWAGEIRFKSSGIAQALSPDTQRHTLRILREALANIRNHANASTIDAQLTFPEQRIGPVRLCISDNGCGFVPAPRRPGHCGHLMMRETASEMHGTFSMESAIGKGTSIQVTFPTAISDDEEQEESCVGFSTAPVLERGPRAVDALARPKESRWRRWLSNVRLKPRAKGA